MASVLKKRKKASRLWDTLAAGVRTVTGMFYSGFLLPVMGSIWYLLLCQKYQAGWLFL